MWYYITCRVRAYVHSSEASVIKTEFMEII